MEEFVYSIFVDGEEVKQLDGYLDQVIGVAERFSGTVTIKEYCPKTKEYSWDVWRND